MKEKEIEEFIQIVSRATRGLWHDKDNDSDEYRIRALGHSADISKVQPNEGHLIAVVLDNDGRSCGGGGGEDARAIVTCMNFALRLAKHALELHRKYEVAGRYEMKLMKKHEMALRKIEQLESKIKKKCKKGTM